MWEVMSYGERPYWDMTNQDVSIRGGWAQPNVGLFESLHRILESPGVKSRKGLHMHNSANLQDAFTLWPTLSETISAPGVFST